MNWISVVWPMIAAVCLTMGLVHAVIWLCDRRLWGSVLFAAMAFGVAGLAVTELWTMQSTTPAGYGFALRWLHLPAWVTIVGLVGFVRIHLRSGRSWLAWAIVGVRTLSLLLNFASVPNLNFREITALRTVRFLGETISVADGVPNPWMLVGQASLAMLVVFVVDAAITVWRRGDPWPRRVLSAAIVFFIGTGTTQAVLSMWEIVGTPITASLLFVGVTVAMGVELSLDVLRAARLGRDLQASEVRLSESQARLNVAAESAGAGFWELDFATGGVWATKQAREQHHLGVDVPINFRHAFAAIDARDRRRVLAHVAHASRTRGTISVEYRVGLPDGQVRWLLARGRVSLRSDGNPNRLMGVCGDITTRKQAEEHLIRSEAFSRTILASLKSQIAILDRDGVIVAVNDAWKDFGRTGGFAHAQSGVGLDYLEVCRRAVGAGSQDAQRTWEGMRSVLDGTTDSFEMEYLCPAPSEASWFLLRVVPLNTPDGGAIVSHSDITQMKQSELEIARHREELAHSTRVSTLGQFAATLAHELNQPLGAILSNAEAAEIFLKRPVLALDEVKAALDDIRQDGRRASDTLYRMRELLRKKKAETRSLGIVDLIDSVVDLTRAAVQSRHATLHVEAAPDLARVLGDSVQVQQVLLNLILNALQAMEKNPEDGRGLLILVARVDPNFIEFSVCDSGPGFARERLARIFEPFSTTKDDGMGMGLAICRTLVEAHGGRIRVENNPGGGAMVSFTLPVADD